MADFVLHLDEVEGILAEDVGPDDLADFGGQAGEEGAFWLRVYG